MIQSESSISWFLKQMSCKSYLLFDKLTVFLMKWFIIIKESEFLLPLRLQKFKKLQNFSSSNYSSTASYKTYYKV